LITNATINVVLDELGNQAAVPEMRCAFLGRSFMDVRVPGNTTGGIPVSKAGPPTSAALVPLVQDNPAANSAQPAVWIPPGYVVGVRFDNPIEFNGGADVQPQAGVTTFFQVMAVETIPGPLPHRKLHLQVVANGTA
jgi:hypothetical protein